MITKNIFINYLGTGLVGVINIVALAWYSKVYGLENWGAIAACIAIGQIVGFLEFGISQLYISEFQKINNGVKIFRKYQLAIIFRGFFGSIIVLVIFLIFLNLFKFELKSYYNLYFLVLTIIWGVLNLIIQFYYTNLIASGKQLKQNVQCVLFTSARVLTAVFAGHYLSKSPDYFLISFILVFLLEIIYNEFCLKKEKLKLSSFSEMNKELSNSKFLTFGVSIGIIAFYSDRTLLPLMMTPFEFGTYAIVATLGLYCLQLQYPLIKAVFPWLAKKHHTGNIIPQIKYLLYQILFISFSIGILLLIIGYFSTYILNWYSINEALLKKSEILLKAILISIFINSIYNVFYLDAIVRHKYLTIFISNLLGLITVLTVIATFGFKDGFFAGSISWILVSSVQLVGMILSKYFEISKDKLNKSKITQN